MWRLFECIISAWDLDNCSLTDKFKVSVIFLNYHCIFSDTTLVRRQARYISLASPLSKEFQRFPTSFAAENSIFPAQYTSWWRNVPNDVLSEQTNERPRKSYSVASTREWRHTVPLLTRPPLRPSCNRLGYISETRIVFLFYIKCILWNVIWRFRIRYASSVLEFRRIYMKDKMVFLRR